ncbi:acylphosphatase-1-like [Hemiscyllium ocellatum]|uniref:acylphosphatase-1-like n=1 Tax=Hemiscyllium ocellatum TaxID=170820 RepID=UPI0029668D72|nr:acylphosphatase-1-like [Hemiscyllium ocellatum]
MASGGEGPLLSVDFEVFGKVQRVFFRKHTQKEAKRLGLAGWVENTEQGTVRGQLQGAEEPVRAMQTWLRRTGSPKARIDRAAFSNQKRIQRRDYSDFHIIKSPAAGLAQPDSH